MIDQLRPLQGGSKRYRAQIDWPVNLGLILFMATAASLSINGNLAHGNDRGQALAFATAVAIFAVILIPFPPASPRRAQKLILWASFAGAACMAQSVILSNTGLLYALRLGILVGLFVLAAGGMRQAIAMRTNKVLATAAVVVVVLDFCAAPIALGPIAEHLSTHRLLVDAIVNISPVTHFATALGFDYLRDTWFYRYSPVGSIRFDYATPTVCAIGYALVYLVSQYLFSVQLRQWESTRR